MTPARVLPVPMAPIMLSPPPALTMTPGFKSSNFAVEAAESLHDFFAFGRGGSITPEFCRANNLIISSQWDKTMLLSADADGLNLRSNRLGLAKGAADATRRGIAPGMRMLLLRAWRKVGDQIIFL